VIQCQLNYKKVLSHDLLNNISRFHPFTIYSPFFFINSRKTILSRLMPIHYLLRSPTCITAAAGTGFCQDYKNIILSMNNFLIFYFSSTGSNFRSLPNIPHCCQRECLFFLLMIQVYFLIYLIFMIFCGFR